MAEGNAGVAELDTAPAPPETTEAETFPESELAEETDPVGSDGSTDSADQESDGEADEAEPETLTREEHDKALKAATAKLEESFRQRGETQERQATELANANAYKANVTQSQNVKAGAVYSALMNHVGAVIKSRDEGNDVTVDAGFMSQLARAQADAAFWDQDAAIASFFDAHTAQANPGWRKPPELAADLERALHLHATDPNRPAQVLSARLSIMESAVREQLTPKLREEIEATVRAELGAAGKTAAMKQADAARAGQPKPTGVGTTGGRAAHNFKTQQQVDMALFKNEIDTNTARKWLAKGLPYS